MQLNKNSLNVGFMPLPQGWARRQAKSSKKLTKSYGSSWNLFDIEKHHKEVERASQTVLYSNLNSNSLAQPLEHSNPPLLYVNKQLHRKRPRVEDTVDDIIRQAKNNNSDGLSSCSSNAYRPWRSVRDLHSDTYGQGTMASGQSFYNFNENFHNRNAVDYSLMASDLTPQHHHVYSSSPQFDEWQNFSQLTNDCALLSQPPEIENDQSHISSDCNCNASSRKIWLNPFHPTRHFDPSGDPLGQSIYSTGHSICDNQDGLLRRNSSGWHFWQFRNQPYLETAPSIQELTLPENGVISPCTPSSRFRNCQRHSSNHLEPFSHIQDPTEEVTDCNSLLRDCRSSFLTKDHLDFLERDHTFGNLCTNNEADKQKQIRTGERKNGSLPSSLIADLTKDWSPLPICRDDDNDNVGKDRTQSASIQTENIPSTNAAVQTDDYRVACQECKKLRSALDRVLHHSMNRLDSTASRVNFKHLHTSTPRLPSNSSQVHTEGVDVGFISPVTTNTCARLDFQKNVRTEPPVIFPKNRDNRLVCKGLSLSDSNED